jgi:hypothetical protein
MDVGSLTSSQIAMRARTTLREGGLSSLSLERECVECVECVCAINGKFVVIVPWPLRGRQRLSLYSSFFPSTPSGRRDIDDTRPLTSSLSAFLTRRRYSNHAAWARRHHALLNSLVRPAVLPVAAVRAANPQSKAHIRAAFPTSPPIPGLMVWFQ